MQIDVAEPGGAGSPALSQPMFDLNEPWHEPVQVDDDPQLPELAPMPFSDAIKPEMGENAPTPRAPQLKVVVQALIADAQREFERRTASRHF